MMASELLVAKASSQGSLVVSLRPFLRASTETWSDPVDHDVARMLDLKIAREQFVLPFQLTLDRLYVAAADPGAISGLSPLLRLQEKLQVSLVLCSAQREDVMLAIDRVEGLVGISREARLGSLLLESGKLSGSQLLRALDIQKATGSRLGSILASSNSVTSWDVAEALGRQKSLPLIDLQHQHKLKTMMNDPALVEVWDKIPESFWYRHLCVPLAVDEQSLTIAIFDPDDTEAIELLKLEVRDSVRVMISGYRDIVAALTSRFSHGHEEESRLALVKRLPEDSAHFLLSKEQLVALIALVVLIVATAAWQPLVVFTIFAAVVQLVYGANSLFRLWLMQSSSKVDAEYEVSQKDLERIEPSSLPAYTILVPLYKESAVLPTLVNAIRNIRYPKERLDVKLLLEEDDEETIQAAMAAGLPSYFEFVIVPPAEPRTKPKACNYGLMRARGDFVVIYDAEDIPDSDQLLKAVTVFRENEDKNLGCVQAKLSYFNANQNILTRWFTAEYANWFELSLPSMFAYDLPVPLGGTSNHFRTEVLRELGAWDPYNVTEDADLGIRLHKMGYRTAIVNSTTLEEANGDFVNWIRQRSRWVKGYMQTWLVHMRKPIKLHRSLGLKGSFAFHMIVGATPLTFLLNPILLGMSFVWILFQPLMYHEAFQGWVYYLAEANFLFGNFVFTYVNIIGVMQRKNWSLAKYALLSPIYWLFMSIASWKGLYQLIVKPSYWEKTTHGLSEYVPTELESPYSLDASNLSYGVDA